MVKPIYPDSLCRYVTFSKEGVQQPPIGDAATTSPKIRCYSSLGKFILEASSMIREWAGIKDAKTDIWTYCPKSNNKSAIFLKASDAKAFWNMQHDDNDDVCPETAEAWQNWLNKWATIQKTTDAFQAAYPRPGSVEGDRNSPQELAQMPTLIPVDDTPTPPVKLSEDFNQWLDDLQKDIAANDLRDIGPIDKLLDSSLIDYIEWLGQQNKTLFIPPRQDNEKGRGQYVISPRGENGKTSITDAILLDAGFRKDSIKTNARIFAYPLHVSGNHWTLVLMDRDQRTVEYYDSFSQFGNHDEIVQHLQGLTATLSKEDPGPKPYTFKRQITKAIQNDNYQCGPWTLYFLEHRLKDPSVDFNTLDRHKRDGIIKDYRAKVTRTLKKQEHKKEERIIREYIIERKQDIAEVQTQYPAYSRKKILELMAMEKDLRLFLKANNLPEDKYFAKFLKEIIRE
jgi:hypothetical protein